MGTFKGIYLLIFLVSCQFVMAEIIINEIMYNPEGSDNNREFIEIYHAEQINLSNWVIRDSSSNDTLILLKYISSNYSLIVEDDFNYSEIPASVYSAGAAIGNNLDNTEDAIYLYDNNYSLIDTIVYSSSWGADGNGYSLEKINPNGTNTEENWGASLVMNGTPGAQNSLYGTEEIDYSQIEINEFLPNPEGDDNAPMPEGEWVELYNPSNYDFNMKWAYIEDLEGHKIYIADTRTNATTIISAKGFLVVYMNGFSGFLNNDGIEELKFYSKDNELIDEVSYEGSVEGSSWAKIEGYWQSTMPTPGNINKNYSEVKDSVFEIEKIYDLGSYNRAKFGQTIRAKVDIWKGDDTKSSISLWVEDEEEHRISKYSTASIYAKYMSYEFALPVQLYPNCDENYEDGNYTLHIGWTSDYEIRDSYNFSIKGISNEVCIEKEEPKEEKVKKFVYELASIPDEIEEEKGFEVRVRLINNENKMHNITVWSYVYRGPKSYSGEREGNKKELVLPRNNEITIALKNKVKEAEPGNYKLKVMIMKDAQKTPYIITENISIIAPFVEEKENRTIQKSDEATGLFLVDAPEDKEVLEPEKETKVVYESTSEKSNKLIPYFMIFTCLMLDIVLIWKR